MIVDMCAFAMLLSDSKTRQPPTTCPLTGSTNSTLRLGAQDGVTRQVLGSGREGLTEWLMRPRRGQGTLDALAAMYGKEGPDDVNLRATRDS